MTEPVQATDAQLAYLRKLVEAKGEDIHQYLIDRGISKPYGYPQVKGYTAVVPSKARCSELIAELAPARPLASSGSYRGRGWRR